MIVVEGSQYDQAVLVLSQRKLQNNAMHGNQLALQLSRSGVKFISVTRTVCSSAHIKITGSRKEIPTHPETYTSSAPTSCGKVTKRLTCFLCSTRNGVHQSGWRRSFEFGHSDGMRTWRDFLFAVFVELPSIRFCFFCLSGVSSSTHYTFR